MSCNGLTLSIPVLQAKDPGLEDHLVNFFKLETKFLQIVSPSESCGTQATPWFIVDCSECVTNEITF